MTGGRVLTGGQRTRERPIVEVAARAVCILEDPALSTSFVPHSCESIGRGVQFARRQGQRETAMRSKVGWEETKHKKYTIAVHVSVRKRVGLINRS